MKNKKGFESNVVILLKNELDWIFNRDESEVIDLKNERFKDRILEVREVISNNSLENIYIDVFYVTKGDLGEISEGDEINAEIKKIKEKYDSAFKNFRFELYGAEQIIEYMDTLRDKAVNAELKLIYDTNVPALMLYNDQSIKSLVCNVKTSELLEIFKAKKNEYVFEGNVRKYLEDRSKVNKN